MLNILARTNRSELLAGVPLERLTEKDIDWYWVDFEAPDAAETALLSTFFGFHELAIEDCIEHLERPKADDYGTYRFFVLHALDQDTLEPIEADLFVGKNYVVSFCHAKLPEMEAARDKLTGSVSAQKQGAAYIAYLVFDKLVDSYFPAVYKTEDRLTEITCGPASGKNLIDRVYAIRADLMKLRHSVNAMKELLYRIIGSGHPDGFRENERHWNDIYDHLLKLSDIIEASREITADARDNFVSINAHKMNRIMTLLTIITSIFIPLTFIVGVYGMNFSHMPELEWEYGYFIVLGAMILLGVAMLVWFKRKGWFDINK